MHRKSTRKMQPCRLCGRNFYSRTPDPEHPNRGQFCTPRCSTTWRYDQIGRKPPEQKQPGPDRRFRPVRPLQPHPTDPDALMVPLGDDVFAVIDREDEHLVSGKHWRATPPSPLGVIYAYCNRESLHRTVMGNPAGIVHHKDDDGLNCRKSNLEETTFRMNNVRARRVNRASGYRGVYLNRSGKRWVVLVDHKYLDTFDDLEEAARAYDKAAREVFGEFARLNFPDEGL